MVLHTFLSDEAVARAVTLVRRGAEEAGRDPDSVTVWSLLATACDVSEEQYLKLMVARMATYMQAPGHGELLVAAHGWDPGVLEAFRRHPVVKSIPGGIDGNATIDQLYEIQKLIPEEWLPAAVGNAEQVRVEVRRSIQSRRGWHRDSREHPPGVQTRVRCVFQDSSP